MPSHLGILPLFLFIFHKSISKCPAHQSLAHHFPEAAAGTTTWLQMTNHLGPWLIFVLFRQIPSQPSALIPSLKPTWPLKNRPSQQRQVVFQQSIFGSWISFTYCNYFAPASRMDPSENKKSWIPVWWFRNTSNPYISSLPTQHQWSTYQWASAGLAKIKPRNQGATYCRGKLLKNWWCKNQKSEAL